MHGSYIAFSKATQMYKFYINDTLLILVKSKKLATVQNLYNIALTLRYRGAPSTLLNVIDKAEKSPKKQTLVIHSDEFKVLLRDFKGLYKKIVAAGGLVLNDSGQVLMMFRRGKWDLPKGKMELNEKKKETAVREVMEETGLMNVRLEGKLCKTYHTYRTESKKRILKVSHWYIMHSSQIHLIPQIEEDIEKVEWVDLPEFLKTNPIIYSNILDVCNLYLQQKLVTGAV